MGFCKDNSLQAGEPVQGSAAAGVREWLLVEDAGPWGAKVPRDCEMDAGLRAYLELAPKRRTGLRLQLIRDAGRANALPEVFWVRGGQLLRLEREAAMPEAWWEADPLGLKLADIPVAALSRPVDATGGVGVFGYSALASLGPWQPVDEGHYLVCTHGKRDACCAKWGLPIFAALNQHAPGRVWQTTHLGGHRFAPTFTHLPSGLSYGRVELDDVGPLFAALEQGQVGLANRLRGRSDLLADEQVAYAHLLEQMPFLQGASHDALRLVARAGETQRWEVQVGDETHTYSLVCVRGETLRLLASCADDKIKQLTPWRVAECRLDQQA